MKKIGGVIASVCMALVIFGCASLPPASEGMASAKRKASEDALVGQATASSAGQAESDAKYQLARAMSYMVKDMVDAYVADGRLEYTAAEDFRRGVNNALSRNPLSDAVRLGNGEGSGKVFWAVYSMEKAEVLRVINSAVIASKAAYPAAADFTTEGYEAAYRAQVDKEWRS